MLKNKRTGDVYFVILFALVYTSSSEESPAGSRPSTEDGNVEEPHFRFNHEPAPCAGDVD